MPVARYRRMTRILSKQSSDRSPPIVQERRNQRFAGTYGAQFPIASRIMWSSLCRRLSLGGAPDLQTCRLFATSRLLQSELYRGEQQQLSEEELCITEDEVVRFMRESMEAVGTPTKYAERLALNLIAADLRGHFSHGLSRLAHYVSDVKAGTCDPKAAPELVKEGPTTALVDGKNGLGVVIGEYCMDLAIQKASSSGVGWVAARGSNHFGICQWYTNMAVDKGLIGVTSTNTSPLVTPTRSKEGIFGTNPISIAAPGLSGDSFVLDMSTSAVAQGKIEIQVRKGQPLPSDGWAIRKSDGKPTTDSEEALKRSVQLPLGGAELNSGYKGYGLGMAAELICGLMSGSSVANNIRLWTQHDVPANLGQCFIAVDPESFAPGLKERLQDLMNTLRSLAPVDPSLPVLVPGDPERLALEQNRRNGFIKYTNDHVTSYRRLAQDLGVRPMSSRAK